MTPARDVFDLAVEPPFDPEPLLASLAAHAVAGVEEVDVSAGTVRRLLDVGRRLDTTVSLAPDGVTVTVDAADGLGPRERERLVPTVRRWFDLDAAPHRVGDHLGRDPLLAPLVVRRPGLRVLGHPSGWEVAVQTVVGQQVSVAAGRTFAGRLVAAFGGDGAGGLRSFPAAATLAACGPADLREAVGLTGARAATLHRLAELCAGGLALTADVDRTEVRHRLRAVPGIGPWTVEYLAVRALGDRDAFPAGDLVLRRAAGIDDARSLARRAEAWTPLRAYAAGHLWASVAGLSPRRRRVPSG